MSLTAAQIVPHLQACGYKLLRTDFPLAAGLTVPVVAFANPPADARSACIAVLEKEAATPDDIASVRGLGAPVILNCALAGLQWWKQTSAAAELVTNVIAPPNIPKFFSLHQKEFEPTAIYRAKTWGRYDKEYQLAFVDLGLMPLVEGEIGERLVELIVRNVDHLKAELQWKVLSESKAEWLLKSVFWLLSAKILRDKNVGKFSSLDLLQVDAVFDSVAKHFGTEAIPITTQKQHAALATLANDVAQFSSLELATTESLAYVYENALISKATRKALGTHSTPSYLVDYIVGRLGNDIQAIDKDKRNVFEPACGHAAFLVSAIRYLTDLLPEDERADAPRRSYLRKRVHGIETDAFALEIARLSLSLTDIPNPNGWDLKQKDMFLGNDLESSARKATIFLANPPFENFKQQERSWYSSAGANIEINNKAYEVFRRVLPELPDGAVIGIVSPNGILHSKEAINLRQTLLNDFEVSEIALLPDTVFEKADSEPAIILGVKKARALRKSKTIVSRVREHDFDIFKEQSRASFTTTIETSSFAARESLNMRFAELEQLWEYCTGMPRLDSIADLGQGFFFKGQSLPPGATTYSQIRFSGSVPAFIRFDVDYIHQLPKMHWANLNVDVIDRPVKGTKTNVSQVIMNYAPVSRGPWRIKALIDRVGHAVSSRFIVVRPKIEEVSIEFLWAYLNSPLVSAYAFTHFSKRDNLVGGIRNIFIVV